MDDKSGNGLILSQPFQMSSFGHRRALDIAICLPVLSNLAYVLTLRALLAHRTEHPCILEQASSF